MLEAVGAAFYAATSRTLAGRALAQAGEPDRAAAELERAAAAFDSFGSARYRAAVEQELRKLGRKIHRRTRPGEADATGVGSLTARELEIARLVVDRKTNPEIATALFLSPKTVESHLRNVFHKLDVSSRVEVARAVERSEFAAPHSSREPPTPGAYTHIRLIDVEDAAPANGFGEHWEARVARTALGAEHTGVTHFRLRPGKRSPCTPATCTPRRST